MYHMYSIFAVQSRVPVIHLQHKGHSRSLDDLSAEIFLPSVQDMTQLKYSLTLLVGRLLAQHIPALSFLSSIVPTHISHKYSLVMCQQSSVSVVDVRSIRGVPTVRQLRKKITPVWLGVSPANARLLSEFQREQARVSGRGAASTDACRGVGVCP